MRVAIIEMDRVEERPLEDLAELARDHPGVLWVDMDARDPRAAHVLGEVLGLAPSTVRASLATHEPIGVGPAGGALLLVVHGAEATLDGTIHKIKLDQVVGGTHLVSVHQPVGAHADPGVVGYDTEAVWEDLAAGRLHCDSSAALSNAIVVAMARRMEELAEALTADVWRLEQRILLERHTEDQAFVDELFLARQSLVTAGEAAAASAAALGKPLPEGHPLAAANREHRAAGRDLLDRVNALFSAQVDYLDGVIEFHLTRLRTHALHANERFAVIALLTLPATAVADLLGMRLIVVDRVVPALIGVLMILMATMSGFLLTWSRRKGWW